MRTTKDIGDILYRSDKKTLTRSSIAPSVVSISLLMEYDSTQKNINELIKSSFNQFFIIEENIYGHSRCMNCRVLSSHGHPFSRAHLSTSKWPFEAALEQVELSHSQPFRRAHLSTSKWPFKAAFAQVKLSHSQPFRRAHLSTSKCPFKAALSQVQLSHSQPFSRAHLSTSKWPFSAAFLQVQLPQSQPF